MTARPLTGRVVVVTRAGPRAHDMTDALARAGAEVIELALTAQLDAADGGAALRAATASIGQFAWVVLTSVNAVECLLDALGGAGVPGTVRFAAVGPATAAALRGGGVPVELVPSTHNASALVDAFPVAGPEQTRAVLFPAADQAPGTLGDGLRAKGWDVQRVEAYRTVTLPAPEPARLARVSDADAIALTAASAVRAFRALRSPTGAPLEPPGLVVTIGPSTTDAARAAGWHVTEAPRASSEGVVAAIVDGLGSAASSAS